MVNLYRLDFVSSEWCGNYGNIASNFKYRHIILCYIGFYCFLYHKIDNIYESYGTIL